MHNFNDYIVPHFFLLVTCFWKKMRGELKKTIIKIKPKAWISLREMTGFALIASTRSVVYHQCVSIVYHQHAVLYIIKPQETVYTAMP